VTEAKWVMITKASIIAALKEKMFNGLCFMSIVDLLILSSSSHAAKVQKIKGINELFSPKKLRGSHKGQTDK
jgi:hypothetical protein